MGSGMEIPTFISSAKAQLQAIQERLLRVEAIIVSDPNLSATAIPPNQGSLGGIVTELVNFVNDLQEDVNAQAKKIPIRTRLLSA